MLTDIQNKFRTLHYVAPVSFQFPSSCVCRIASLNVGNVTKFGIASGCVIFIRNLVTIGQLVQKSKVETQTL
jgi:hypothetical protein